jgi:hypothetical protein
VRRSLDRFELDEHGSPASLAYWLTTDYQFLAPTIVPTVDGPVLPSVAGFAQEPVMVQASTYRQ